MPSKRAATLVRSWPGRLLGAAVALTVLCTTALISTVPAAADSAIAPKAGTFTVKGSGFGHGRGMSQWGAYGAARSGLSWEQILAFYYPGTTQTTMPRGTTIKVWITADNDDNLRVLPADGLTVSDADGGSYEVPVGAAYKSWRIIRSGAGFKLSYRNADGAYVTKATGLSDSTWTFATTAKTVKIVLPSGYTKTYRGSASLVPKTAGARTVNKVLLEDYVKGVVAAEMPTSWSADAVRAQTVAARSYAVRLRDFYNYTGYEICDTTNCQVYAGLGAETAAGNRAVEATAGTILTYQGKVALTEFGASNGGHTVKTGLAYQKAYPDRYDGAAGSQAWTRTITATSVARAWPSVGTVKKLQVVSRDGGGAWGGRVTTIKIIGSAGTVSVGGSTFQYKFGLRSSLYSVSGATPAPAPTPPPPAPEPEPQPEPAGSSKGAAYASFPRSYTSASPSDLLLISGAGQLQRYPVANGTLGSPVTIATGAGGYTHVLNAGDWNGDGYQDVIVRSTAQKLYLKRGTADGTLAAGIDMGFGANIRAVVAIGDANRDKHPDLAVITEAGNLWLYYGDGTTGRKSRTMISRGWQKADLLRAPGDFDGDGRPDLITRAGGSLRLHRGTASGFKAPVTMLAKTTGISTITAVGDVDADDKADVVARTSAGKLVVYRGNGKASLTRGVTLPGTFSGTRFAL